jgi:hypothetical protein
MTDQQILAIANKTDISIPGLGHIFPVVPFARAILEADAKQRASAAPSNLVESHQIKTAEIDRIKTPESGGIKPAEPEWIEWYDGECPVKDGVRCGIKFRNGSRIETCQAAAYRWTHTNGPGSIIAYRVWPAAEKVEPRKELTIEQMADILRIDQRFFIRRNDNKLNDNLAGCLREAGYTVTEPPRTITVNGVEVPEPLREPPENGTFVWVVSPSGEIEIYKWDGKKDLVRALNFGLLHLTESAASAHFEAMIKPSRRAENG